MSGQQTFPNPPNIEWMNVKNSTAISIIYNKKSIVIYTHPYGVQLTFILQFYHYIDYRTYLSERNLSDLLKIQEKDTYQSLVFLPKKRTELKYALSTIFVE